MSTSDISVVNNTPILSRDAVWRNAMGELIFAAGCALFGGIYEVFSFGVFSFFMIYAFAVPLIMALFMLSVFRRERAVPGRFISLLHMTSVTAALGCIATGVVEIYGVDNHLLYVYPVLCAVLFIAALISFKMKRRIQ